MFIAVKNLPKLPVFCYAINLYVSNNKYSIPMLLDPIKIEHYLEISLGVGHLWVQRWQQMLSYMLNELELS